MSHCWYLGRLSCDELKELEAAELQVIARAMGVTAANQKPRTPQPWPWQVARLQSSTSLAEDSASMIIESAVGSSLTMSQRLITI